MKNKDILVIFKTHLDIGYTDYAETVKKQYIESFIPNAIRVGYELKDTDTPFIWTTGSWLIWEALKYDSDETLSRAIEDGIICWHGLPCTTHTELMNCQLFNYGLSISKKLDKRFGKHTIAAKMTDVPGHTIGMVPLMKKAGIEFLHIGVNTATPLAPVPPVFKWKCGNDEITVMYRDGYGDAMEFDDFVIYFAHTFDNMGPQSASEITELYNKIKKEYPGCNIIASTLNDAALRLRTLKNIPVIDKEIGDTWIHGVGTDPKKVGMYRQILRNISNRDISNEDLADNLLLVPEHTWGMCLAKYFNDISVWFNEDFKKTEGSEKRVHIEKSWQEQRDYVTSAAVALNIPLEYNVELPSLDGYEKADIDETDFEISWQLFDRDDYTRYINDYMTLTAENIGWASWDYIKYGLCDYKGGTYTAHCVGCYKKSDSFIRKFEFDEDVSKKYGLPVIYAITDSRKTEIRTFVKEASRLPQALWIKFKGFNEDWELNKMGQWIKPEDIIGSPLISAIDTGIRNKDYEIISEDAVLVAPYGRKLLHYGEKNLKQDMYFNLYNNIWNTNFPFWYSDDTRYVFKINKR